jgi:type II secretory pathway component PulF
MILKELFQEKVRLLESFLEQTKGFREKFNTDVDIEKKLDWVDELSDLRENSVNVMKALDQAIDRAKSALNRQTIVKLQADSEFGTALEKTLQLIKEIQLTDQSLFLYIQTMGSELRAQIIRGLKEKEAVSKFKSQVQTQKGDETDQTV